VRFLTFLLVLSLAPAAFAAETQSVRPGINDTYLNPDINAEAQNKGFTSENRETFANRMEIAAAIGLKPGMTVADVGAGTGIYEPVFAKAVGPAGKVYAVDISKPLLAFIEKSMKEAGITNVTTVVGSDKTINLPPNSVDVVFTSDVYHHFEYPQAVLADIRRALKDGGQFIVVDYDNIPGVTAPSRLQHVRTDKKTVIAEVTQAGFKPPEEVKISGLKESFFLRFRK
jgi:ubiquinone/menaquinone biosynthesis C-methylase UbiE